MRLVFGQDQDVAAWVAKRIPHMAGPFGPCVAIGVVSELDQALAGVVFTEYRPEFKSLEMACAADSARWLTQSIVKQIFTYPFTQLDCIRVTLFVPRRNKRTRKFVEALGFRCEGVLRKGLLTDDAVIYGLLRDEWRRSKWARNGKVSASSPSAAEPGGGGQRPGRGQPGHGAASSYH